MAEGNGGSQQGQQQQPRETDGGGERRNQRQHDGILARVAHAEKYLGINIMFGNMELAFFKWAQTSMYMKKTLYRMGEIQRDTWL